MPKIAIYREILDWSADRPPWQQDALRRLVTQERIEETDIADLASLCKAKHGLEDCKEAKPLKKSHLPITAATDSEVRLKHLKHQMGVNALASDQTLQFGPNLTIVYGDNGAGKSGYARILKRACRARGAEPILGDVTSNALLPPPSALIRYSVGGKFTDFQWNDRSDPDRLLSRVSVFDRQCASVYITKPTDVAFRPMGLDLFDRLAAISEEVRKVLERERRDLEKQERQLPTVASNTPVASLLENLTALTDPGRVRELSSLSETDLSRATEIRAHIRDIESNDPQAVAKTLSLRAERLSSFLNRLKEVSATLSESSVLDLFQAKSAYQEAKEVLERRSSTFKSMAVAGTGSTRWRRLWDAAREFFIDAYPNESHPSRNALCVLCQQPHSNESFERMQEIERHMSSTIQVSYEEAEIKYQSARDGIEKSLLGELVSIGEISIDSPELSAKIESFCEYLKNRREFILASLRNGGDDISAPFKNIDFSLLSNHISHLRARVKAISASNSTADLATLKNELGELDARHALCANMNIVLAEIQRKQRISVYQQCINETRTNAITRKSTELTKKAVTGRLVQAFTDELARLKFAYVEVDLIEAGGSRGALYHKLALKRSPGTDLAEVVSEGEARCLSIASFFAELSTADDRSAILFDDPVSSLDQAWRCGVQNGLWPNLLVGKLSSLHTT